MAAETPKAPTIYTLRRNLDPGSPVLIRATYATGRHQIIKTLLFTRSWKQAMAMPEGVDCCHIPDGMSLSVGAIDLLVPDDGLTLVTFAMFLPYGVSYSTLTEIADLGLVAECLGARVKFLDPDDGESLPFDLVRLVRLCLAYAGSGLPDLLGGRVVVNRLLGPRKEEV